MRRVFTEGGLTLIITFVYLFVLIVLRVPFFTIFLIGCSLFVIGVLGMLFFKNDLPARKFSMYVGLTGGLSAVFIWLFVHYLLSKLT